MWNRQGKFRGRSLTPVGNLLVTETEGFLSGGFVEVLKFHGDEIPGWAWLNELAHGEFASVAQVSSSHDTAVTSPDNEADASWRIARQLLADELLGLVGRDVELMRRLQREVLVPLELRLMHAEADQPLTAALLVTSTRAALRSSISE